MMNEKEKCRLGELYDANNDGELIAERQRCKDVCHEYNHLLSSDMERRTRLFARLLGKTGRNFLIE